MWLLCVSLQGDRFGGALDGAARMFSQAYDSGMIPMEFVNQMRKEGTLIAGIGHRVKSVSYRGLLPFITTHNIIANIYCKCHRKRDSTLAKVNPIMQLAVCVCVCVCVCVSRSTTQT